MDASTVIAQLNLSIAELHRKVDEQARILDELRALRDNIEIDGQSSSPPGLSRADHLEAVIRDAITTLEQSKRAFRSKQLELLRRRMMQALIDPDSGNTVVASVRVPESTPTRSK